MSLKDSYDNLFNEAEAKKQKAGAKLDQHAEQTKKAKEIFDKFFTEVFYPKVEETAAYLKEKGHYAVVSDKHNVWGSNDRGCSIYVLDKNRANSKDDIRNHAQTFGFQVVFNSSSQQAEFAVRAPAQAGSNKPHEHRLETPIHEAATPAYADEVLSSFMKGFVESLR